MARRLTSRTILFFLLAGTAAFGSGLKARSIIPADSTPRSLAVSDFNRDGKLDLAVVSSLSDATVSVRLGNGNGSFGSQVRYVVGNQPYAAAAGDVNRDGNPDLVVTNSLDDSVSVLLGNGDGSFQSALTFATGNDPQGIALGDFNGDGIADIATASDPVEVLVGNGDGSFEPASPVTSLGAYSVAVADLNRDGNIDLLVGIALG
nr:VCBS repeat-containing protein [Terriglobales bacterium]